VFSLHLPTCPTQFDIGISSPTSQEQGLDSYKARSTHSHTPTLAQKSARRNAITHNAKTDIVVAVVGVVVVASSRTAVLRIVVPRTTAQQPV